ncbi:S41 family peptidase [Persephonella sp.]
MIKTFFYLVFILSAVNFISCSGNITGDDSPPPPWVAPYEYQPDNCSSTYQQNEFIYRLFKDIYFWYKKVPDNINIADYNSPSEILEALRYKELDKWSYITDKDDYFSYYDEGTYVGIGFRLQYDSDDNLRVAFTFPKSPAEKNGIQRGDTILSINGKTIKEIENEKLWNTIFGEDKVGTVVELIIKKISTGNIETLYVAKDIITIDPVPIVKIFELNGKKVGYILFLYFINTAETKLNESFSYLIKNNVDELIIDMRYNSGGRLFIATELVSLITDQSDKTFIKYIYNDRYSQFNWEYRFLKLDKNLNPSRVIILSTNSTCSASESVINGLKPYIDTILIGAKTCGKPVGMDPIVFCDKVVSPITFETRNANNEGEYFEGIHPDCVAVDNFDISLGNENEDMLKEALYFIENNSCKPKGQMYYPTKTLDDQLIGFKKETGLF